MIRTTALTKRYGAGVAVDGVDLQVDEGSIYGLVGPNGAGKTTLLGLVSGLRRPTSGSLHVEARLEEIAVLPDTPKFDPWLTGREVVVLAQSLSQSKADRVDEVIHDAGIEHAAGRAVGGYSRGMLQRLGVACTVVGSPRLLLLDEPASALDPLGRREVLDLVARLRGVATVLFSSHILSDVQQVCDTVGVMDKGKMLFQGPLEGLLVGSALPRYVVRCRPPIEPVVAALAAEDWVQLVEQTSPDEASVTVRSLTDAESRLAGALAAAGARVISLGPEAVSLERAFLELTGQ
ncbi:MAG TPA: ABC transporter ATP-binding protein [Actinomycetota bacterium]|nr:ABC transporter ATP-binding protein [Actinomycetota bacterium]